LSQLSAVHAVKLRAFKIIFNIVLPTTNSSDHYPFIPATILKAKIEAFEKKNRQYKFFPELLYI
jgi:hypothetical protein